LKVESCKLGRRHSGFCKGLSPGTENFAPHPLKRTSVTGDDAKSSRQGDCDDQRIAQRQWTRRLCGDPAPNGSGAGIEIQNAILAGQICNKRFDPAVIGMVGPQGMKALPGFRQSDCRNEQMGSVLAGVPFDYALIRARLSDFADEIRVEDEAHKDTRLTRSSGMRGISQSVVPRIESYHAMSCWVVRADVRLRRRGRILAAGVSSNCCSQAKSFLACFGDKRLTSLMAISTALTSKICAWGWFGARIESGTRRPVLRGTKALHLKQFHGVANRTHEA
jgi:hypothetical protein